MISCDNYLFFVENKAELKDQIISSLEGNESAYQYLIENGYLKRKEKSLLFSFHFVGTISTQKYIICVLPKYYIDQDLKSLSLIDDFVEIIKVLRKAGTTEPSIPDYNHISTNDNLNLSELVIADKLIKDYLECGLLIKSKDLVELNTEGEVNWDRTIEYIDPIFSKKRPIYLDSYNSSIITEEYNLITEIHKWVVKKSLIKYGKLLDYHFDFQEDCVNDFFDLGSMDFLCSLMRSELNERYIDRDIILIKCMLAFLQNGKDASNNIFTLYGTGYFDIIWEKACGVFTGNKIDNFKKKIPHPLWHDIEGNEVPKKTLLPDIITHTEDKSLFFLLDAKYYNLIYHFQPFNITGNPGIEDVSKQFLYHKVFEELPFKKKINCFLFPALQHEIFKIVGSVTFPLFIDLRIFNLCLSTKKVFDSYLNNISQNEDFLNELALCLNHQSSHNQNDLLEITK